MQGNWKTAVGALALVAVGAAGAWLVKPGAPPAGDGGHGPAQGGVGLPSGATAVGAPEAASAVDAPVAPTWVAMVNPQAGPAGQFVAHDLNDGAKVVRMAEDAVGSPDQRNQLRRSTWRVVFSGTQVRTATLAVDLAHGVVLRDEETGDEVGWLDGTCWGAREEVVFPCSRPLASMMRGLQWTLRAIAVTAITEPPWHMTTATCAERDHKLINTLTYETQGEPHLSTGMVIAEADPITRRLTSLDVSSSRKKQDQGAAILSRARADLDEPRAIDVWTVATLAHLTLIDQSEDRVVMRVVDIRAGSQLPKGPRPLSLPKGLQVGNRPGTFGLVFAAGTHDKFVPAVNKATDLLASPLRQSQFDIVEAFAPLGQDRDQGIDAWMVARNPVLMTRPGLAVHSKPLPAEAAVVRKWVQVPFAQVPAEIATLMREAEQAGYKPAAGRRATAIYLHNEEGDTPVVTLELALPIDPP